MLVDFEISVVKVSSRRSHMENLVKQSNEVRMQFRMHLVPLDMVRRCLSTFDLLYV